jgi:hypothetical protein
MKLVTWTSYSHVGECGCTRAGATRVGATSTFDTLKIVGGVALGGYLGFLGVGGLPPGRSWRIFHTLGTTAGMVVGLLLASTVVTKEAGA